MSEKLNILMVLPEISPFTHTGELSDLGGSIPRELKDMGMDIRLITPQYRAIDERRFILRDVIRLQNIEIPLANEKVTINVKSSFLPNSKIQVYFIDYRPFFARTGMYKDPESGEPYQDNAERFILFSKSVFETLIRLQWQPDVIHCHGWQAGLVPFFLKTEYKSNPFFNKCSTLLTVYDFADLGIFNKTCADFLSPKDDFSFNESPINLNGNCSFLKAGIAYSDYINTLSDTYLKDVLNGCESAKPVYDLIKKRKNSLISVTNGIDYSEWDPENDKLIAENFSAEDLSGKSENRKILREKLGLKVSENEPVICLVTELKDRKGIKLIQESLEKLMASKIGFVVMGHGKREYETYFSKAEKKYKGRLKFINSFAKDLIHTVVAGSDMVLIPSKYEPCGLIQMYCMRYGTVPVVRLTGGLVDTVIPIRQKSDKGTGFEIDKYTPAGIVRGISKAIKYFEDKDVWQHIQKQCMLSDNSIKKAVEKYVEIYKKCIGKKE
ncbi:glycogen synthase GlgA [candidate division KSB1 bacterium]|nr:MAG: glycogen synthase GlgA [candidate division KSB1 bacterium]